ncbi:Uncharacterized protein Adt_39398 [Abeliophyllum distichum]|uniref:Uncharacterized protein n=1 Tax=Abeliophyllum distichum TaxID=126358 RepID=A0ABD1Q614_9LAMI
MSGNFEELSRYDSHLVCTKLMKARYCERGLRLEIRKIVSSHEFLTFRAVVRKARTMSFSSLKIDVQGQYNDSGKKNGQKRIEIRIRVCSKDKIRILLEDSQAISILNALNRRRIMVVIATLTRMYAIGE